MPSTEQPCERWVAPAPQGSDGNPGTVAHPWATLAHAAAVVPDRACTVWFEGGVYTGMNVIERRFRTVTTFRAINPYHAALQNGGLVIQVRGGRNMVFEGFELRHTGPGAGVLVVELQRSGESWAEDIVLRNNIFHDSYNNDLLKIHNGSRNITVEGNVFYNQSGTDQHIDINSATDVIIRGNIFFNDFAGSGRTEQASTNAFIVIKDSNGGEDGLLGSRRISVSQNIFLNWQGRPGDKVIKVGNDGRPYYEAQDVWIVSNLIIGNSPDQTGAPFGVSGARNVTFAYNTVSGDLPASAFGFRLDAKEDNPINQDIIFANNIWSDPTGTMGVDSAGSPGEFSDGPPDETVRLVLASNLYWNGGQPIPGGDLVSPEAHDLHRIVADPLLNTDQDGVVLPRWNGLAFTCGTASIRDEFVRLVLLYGQIPANSPVIGQADPAYLLPDDILGRPRDGSPDLGAYEYLQGLEPAIVGACPCC
jgi:hypothetical protein